MEGFPSWEEIAQSEYFQKLPTQEKQKVRDNYLRRILLPKLQEAKAPPDMIQKLSEEFIKKTNPDVTPKGITGYLSPIAHAFFNVLKEVGEGGSALGRLLHVKGLERGGEGFAQLMEHAEDVLNIPKPVTLAQKAIELGASIPFTALDPMFALADIPAGYVGTKLATKAGEGLLKRLAKEAAPHVVAGTTYGALTGEKPEEAVKTGVRWGGFGLILGRIGKLLERAVKASDPEVMKELNEAVDKVNEAQQKVREAMKEGKEEVQKRMEDLLNVFDDVDESVKKAKKKAKRKKTKKVVEVVEKEVEKAKRQVEEAVKPKRKRKVTPIEEVRNQITELENRILKAEHAGELPDLSLARIQKEGEGLTERQYLKFLKKKIRDIEKGKPLFEEKVPKTVEEVKPEIEARPEEVTPTEEGKPEEVLKPETQPKPTPDRLRSVFLGKWGKRKVVFEDPLLARAFDARARERRAFTKNLPDNEVKELLEYVKHEEEVFKAKGIEEPRKFFSAVYNKILEKARQAKPGEEIRIGWDDIPQHRELLKKPQPSTETPLTAEKMAPEIERPVEGEKVAEKGKEEAPSWREVDYKELKPGDYVRTTYGKRTVEGTLGEKVKTMRSGYVARELAKPDGKKTWVAWTPKAKWEKAEGVFYIPPPSFKDRIESTILGDLKRMGGIRPEDLSESPYLKEDKEFRLHFTRKNALPLDVLAENFESSYFMPHGRVNPADDLLQEIEEAWRAVREERTPADLDYKEQIRQKEREGIVKLHAGIPFGEAIGKYAKELKEIALNLLHPAGKSEEARTAASTYRKYVGPGNLANDRFLNAFKEARRVFYGVPEEVTWKYYDLIEKGKVNDEALKQIGITDKKAIEASKDLAVGWRVAREGAWIRLKERGLLKDYVEEYLPHLYEGSAEARGKLRNYFLKKRTIPTYEEAIKMGLKPKYDNPVDLMSAYLKDVHQFVGFYDTLKELQKLGLVKYARSKKKIPDDWVEIKGWKPKVGAYYASEDVARVLNNITSRGLWGRSDLYEAIRQMNAGYTYSQLGFSLFHGTFSAVTDMANTLAIGLSKLLRGEAKDAFKEIKDITPFGVIKHLKEGTRFERLLLGEERPANEFEKAFIDFAKRTNITAKLDRYYQFSKIEELIKAWKKKSPAGVMLNAPLSAIELVGKPVLEYMVPRLKLSAFWRLAQEEIARAKPANELELQKILTHAWDMVEDRFGQLTYDNLFWNRTLKDLLMLAIRAVGWVYGDLREVAGAGKNVGDLIAKFLRGEKIKPADISNRLMFVVSLITTVGLYGAVLNYLLGHKPKKLSDYFYIPTGRKLPTGAPEKIFLASYLKDWVALYKEKIPVFVRNRLSPVLNMLFQLAKNEDYWGREIYSEDGTKLTKLREIADYALKQFTPFSVQGVKRREEAGVTDWKKYLPLVGIMPAPSYATMSEAQEYILKKFGEKQGKTLKEEVARLEEKSEIKKLWRQGKRREAIAKIREMIKKGEFTVRGARQYLRLLSMKDPLVYFFKRLPYQTQVKALEKMDKEEFKKFWPQANIKARMLYIKQHGRPEYAR